MSNAIDVDPEVDSRSSGLIPVYNPSTEEQIAEVADADQAAVDAAVARARETFESGVWRKLPAARRAEVLFRAAEIVKQRSDELAGLESKDNGMNPAAAQQIIKVANEMLLYYAGWSARSTASPAMSCPTDTSSAASTTRSSTASRASRRCCRWAAARTPTRCSGR